MKRIALIVPEYRTEAAEGGGVATVADFLVTNLHDDQTWDVQIISPRMSWRAAESRRVLAPKTWLRGPIVDTRVVAGRTVSYVGANWSEFEFMRFQPRRILDRLVDGYDLALVVSGTPAMCQIMVRARVPVVSQVATMVVDERRRLIRTASTMRRWLMRINTSVTAMYDRRGVRIPEVVVVENEWMYRKCIEMEARQVVLQAPGVDVDHFAPLTQRSCEPGYLLMVGRLNDPRKDLPTLFRAFKLARDRSSIPQKLIIVGSDAPSDEDLQLLSELALEDLVEIKTAIGMNELAELYRHADVFVLSSAEEGLGMVILEAMSSGIPVVCTATEGARYAVGSGGAGTLIEFGSDLESRFARALSDYALDEELRARIGKLARERVLKLFSSKRAGQKFDTILNSAILTSESKKRGK